MSTESDKSVSRSVSLPESVWDKIEKQADLSGKDRSKWIHGAAIDALRAAGALTPSPREQVADAVESALAEGVTPEEITAALRAVSAVKLTA